MTAINDKAPWTVTAKDEPSPHRDNERRPDIVPPLVAERKGWKHRGKPAPPPPDSLDAAAETPLAKANVFSKLTFWWLSPLLRLGFKRPIEDTDLWSMDESRQSTYLTDKLEASINKRQLRAAQWNAELEDGSAKPRLYQRLCWSIRACWPLPKSLELYGENTSFGERQAALEAEWRAVSGRRVASLAWALSDTFPQFWWIGLFKLGCDTAGVVSPLLIKAIIEYNQQAQQNDDTRPSLGRGVALPFASLLLGVFFAVCLAQYQFQGKQTGALMRAALIGAIYRKASELSPRAQNNFPSGTLMTFLSSDTTRIDQAVGFLHGLWTIPLQCIAILVLVCVQIGSAGLIGFLLFVLLLPVQIWIMKFGIRIRNAAIVWTEERTKLLQELLSSMGITKMFTYEIPYLSRLDNMRRKETAGIRTLLFTRAAGFALSNSLPTFGAVLAFIAYSAFHPNMNPAVVFPALAYFNALRGPLQLLPRAVSLLGDALTSLHRISVLLEAPSREYQVVIDPSLDVAISAIDASFEWECVDPPTEKPRSPADDKSGTADAEVSAHSQPPAHSNSDEPFAIKDLSFEVPIGSLTAIVGPVGSGKSSILSGLLGEMRLTGGTVKFAGKVGYCQQSAWIQNATIRNNVLFGQAWDEARYWECIQQAGLVRDLELFPNGDATEIGERGVNLSGGQKQRLGLARALYFDPDIYLLDDPLSAVDARVARTMFNEAILALRNSGKTVVMVTHGLHMLPEVDYIYTISNGAIVEEGTYAVLMEARGPFSQLMDEFGGTQPEGQSNDSDDNPGKSDSQPDSHLAEVAKTDDALAALGADDLADGLPKEETKETVKATLIEAEERKTGALGAAVYAHYFSAGNPTWLLPVAVCAVLYQGSQLMSTVWLTYWAEDKFHEATSFYQGLYATLGVLSGVFCFFMGMCFIVMCINICKKLYSRAAHRVFFSPMRFFETQPTGRLMGIFGKDFEVLDNTIPDILIQALLAVSMA